MQRHWTEIDLELRRLRKEQADVLHLVMTSALEEMQGEQGGRPYERVSGAFAEVLGRLGERINELERDLARTRPNSEFVRRFGMNAHDVYKEKYPITGETKVQDVDTDARSWWYPLYSPIPLSLSEIDPVLRTETREAAFERWRLPNGALVDLAFAPEIDTVFVRARMNITIKR